MDEYKEMVRGKYLRGLAVADKESVTSQKLISEAKQKFTDEDFEGAVSCASDAIRLFGVDDVDLYLLRAQAMQRMGDFSSALSEFHVVLERDPLLVEGYCGRAQCLAGLGRYEDAAKEYEKYLMMEEATVDILDELGSVQISADMYAQAVETFSRAIKMDPYNPRHVLQRAFAYEKLGETEKSKRDFSRINEMDPNHWKQYLEAARRSHEEDAVDYYYTVLKLRPSDGFLFEETATCIVDNILLRRGPAETWVEETIEFGRVAIDLYTKAIQFMGARVTATAYMRRGIVHTMLNDFEEGIADLSASLSVDASLVEARYSLASALMKKGKLMDARVEYETIVEQSQNTDGRAMWEIFHLDVQNGCVEDRFGVIVSDIERIVSLNGDHDRNSETLSSSSKLMQQFESGEDDLNGYRVWVYAMLLQMHQDGVAKESSAIESLGEEEGLSSIYGKVVPLEETIVREIVLTKIFPNGIPDLPVGKDAATKEGEEEEGGERSEEPAAELSMEEKRIVLVKELKNIEDMDVKIVKVWNIWMAHVEEQRHATQTSMREKAAKGKKKPGKK
eukprot:TRINITY_DN10212_c0_g1_i1.p1 TRINITY_DN10212_c0_g1~~TRINITY_DN10212_c0_g1_i1.p1  ORF type:complete len:633 (+),score=197.42 TRINITY_DN10212_c0_g1_i1:216-1901(+)